MGRASGLLAVGSGTSSRSFARAIEFGFFIFFPEAAAYIWQQDPRAPTICKDTRFYDLLSARFMEGGLISDFSSFHLRSKQEERRGPLAVSRADLQDPNPGGPKWGPRPGGAVLPSIKEHLVGAAAMIYWIKTGYSGAILRYVNERYIIDIYEIRFHKCQPCLHRKCTGLSMD